MHSHIALLRGVNVGGNKKLAMADLRALLLTLGFSDVQTVLQSGNAVFRAGERSARRLESLIQGALDSRLGLTSRVFVRSQAELAQVLAANPFVREAVADPAHLLIMFLDRPVEAAKVAALRAATPGPETIAAEGRHVYAVFPEGLARSKLAGPMFDRILGVTSTGRNWNTVNRLATLCPS